MVLPEFPTKAEDGAYGDCPIYYTAGGDCLFIKRELTASIKYNYLVHVGVSSNNLLAPHQLKGTVAILMFDNNSNGY